MKINAALAIAIITVASVRADVVVTDVTAAQRYPWNGLVDITCNVTGIVGETNGLKFAVAAVNPETGSVRQAWNFWVVKGGTNSTDREVFENGAYRLLWDARADLGQIVYTGIVVRVTFDSHSKVQLWEGGPYWADTNIGAEEPWDYGYYFWWGDTVGYKRENGAWVASDGSTENFSFNVGNTPTYYLEDDQKIRKSPSTLLSEGWVVSENGTYILAPEHDAAQVQWGGGWRMPTYQELYDLCYNKCDWIWTTTNGVNGYIVRGRGEYSSASIFLPCAGYGNGTSLYSSGSNGLYWSSVPYSNGYGTYGARELYFLSGGQCMYYNYRGNGQSVRPVQGFTK